MKRLLIAAALLILAVAAGFYIYERATSGSAVRYVTKLGAPGNHSPHGRLPELAMEIAFDQARGTVIARQEDGRVMAWDLATGRAQSIARTDSLFAYCRAERWLLVGESDRVALIDLESGDVRSLASGAYDYAAWSADCSRLALAADHLPTVVLWRTADLSRLSAVETLLPVRNGLAMSDDGAWVAAALGTYDDDQGHKTRLEIFQVSAEGFLTERGVFDDPETIVGMWRMTFAPGAPTLFLGSQVKAKSGLRSLAADGAAVNWGHDGFASYWVRGLAISPNGDFLASGDEKGLLRLWDARSGQKRFEGRTDLVIQSLAFSEDGARLAVALWDSTIGIVDVGSLTD